MNIINWYNSNSEEREQFLENEDGAEGTTPIDRYGGDSRKRYGVKDVPLTMYERGVTTQALKNEIDYWERKMKVDD